MDNTKDFVISAQKLVGVEKLWEAGFRGKGIKVGVVDSGIDPNHPEFEGRIKAIADFTGGNGIDAIGHGTHVAGIIGAANNGTGTIGVAPEVDLYIAKPIPDNNRAGFGELVNAIQWCIDQEVDIINMSLGGPDKYKIPALEAVIKRAHAKNIVLIAAAGNSGLNNGGRINTLGIPAVYPEVWAVGAIDKTVNQAKFSSEGPQIDIVLPGVDIYSTAPGGKYTSMSGTSMATPMFSGCVALIIEKFLKENGRKPNSDELKKLALKHCKDLGQVGLDESYGYGLFTFNHENKEITTFLEDALRVDK